MPTGYNERTPLLRQIDNGRMLGGQYHGTFGTFTASKLSHFIFLFDHKRSL